jgi:hypothetical protein
VQTPNGRELHGVLVAPAGECWRARIMTYPRTLWAVPGGNTTLKFLARSPQEAERLAIVFIREHCKRRNHVPIQDAALVAEPEPIELEQTDEADTDERERRKPRVVPVLFGTDRPSKRAKTADLSEKGVFVATTQPYPAGTAVRLTLQLAGAEIPLRGVVKWTRTQALSGRPAGMGVLLIRPPAFYVQYVQRLP